MREEGGESEFNFRIRMISLQKVRTTQYPILQNSPPLDDVPQGTGL